MEYEDAIEFGLKTHVKATFRNESVQNFILNHERLPLLVSNLATELKGLENQVVAMKSTQEQKRNMVKSLITDFANMFCKAAVDEIAIKRGVNGGEKDGSTCKAD
jgi:hypothetical protein